MAFIWTEAWATGNLMIDTQHKQLFQAINDLLDACTSGRGKDNISKTMHFLINYTAKHFGDEEKLQLSCGYPDAVRHKTLHEDFKKTIADLDKQLQEKGPTLLLVTKVSSSTGDWLIKHIHSEDVKVAAHVKSVGK